MATHAMFTPLAYVEHGTTDSQAGGQAAQRCQGASAANPISALQHCMSAELLSVSYGPEQHSEACLGCCRPGCTGTRRSAPWLSRFAAQSRANGRLECARPPGRPPARLPACLPAEHTQIIAEVHQQHVSLTDPGDLSA